jgi:uncharacterized repeat protein (TIGR01451 family)
VAANPTPFVAPVLAAQSAPAAAQVIQVAYAETANGPFPAAPAHPYVPLPAHPPLAPAAVRFPPYPEQVMDPSPRAVVGMAQPHGEVLFDGGDRDLPVRVTPEWMVQGLEPEDTVGHADTADGRVIVAPSNRIKIYSPRFAAVRSVVDLRQGEQLDALVHHHYGLGTRPLNDSQGLIGHLQNVQARGDIGDKHLQGMLGRNTPLADLAVQLTAGLQGDFLPFENISIIRRGLLENADKPLLAIGRDAAVAWSHDLGVQATVSGRRAASVEGDQRAQATFVFEEKSGPARLRVIKVASTTYARPGDTIDFTIRYDNVGDQMIGNVTILDNLTTRLEYVPDSAQSSRAADFVVKQNDAGSLILRWDIIDPLPKGEGGLVRFRARVR